MDKNKLSISLTTQLSKTTGSATGNPRNKCALKPGHSLMDWIRLGNSGADLSGTQGRLMAVSKEELSKHNEQNDAWMAINGVVYNVSQYMDFHPGGIDELMRGVGTDATKLFNETHAWVNYSQLLNKCRVGQLVNKVKIESHIEKIFRPPDNNHLTEPRKATYESDIKPRLDWIQKRDKLTLFFYTKQYCNPGLLLRKLIRGDLCLEIWIVIGLYVYRFDVELQEHFDWPPQNVHISTESGKMEIDLKKRTEHLWNEFGKFKMSKMLASDLELEEQLEFRLCFKYKFNNDSFAMSLENESFRYILPVGHHLTIEDFVNGEKLNRCYTPVPESYIKKYINDNVDMDVGNIHFLIKRYPSLNKFSKFLCSLEKNSYLKVSLPKGNLSLKHLSAYKKFCFFAAGSGLTPFLSLIDHLLTRNTNRVEIIKLFYFNKTVEDIWCHETLQRISEQENRFEFVNILSKADESWIGLRGRVDSSILLPVINTAKEILPFLAVCGPIDFIKRIKEILSDEHFPHENLFIF